MFNCSPNLILFFPFIENLKFDIKLNTNSSISNKTQLNLEMSFGKFSLELSKRIIFRNWGEALRFQYRTQKIEFESPIKNQEQSTRLVFCRKEIVHEKMANVGFNYFFINRYRGQNGVDSLLNKDFHI